MATQNANHSCVICGEKYHSCDTCKQIKTYTPWRALCDTFPHYNIYLIIRSYQGGIINKNEAKTELQNLNINKITYAKWPENVKKVLDEILSSPTPKKKVAVISQDKNILLTEESHNQMG